MIVTCTTNLGVRVKTKRDTRVGRYYVRAGFAAVALALVLFFLYRLLPTPLTALLTPRDGSAWEGMKLVFWPLLATLPFLSRFAPERPWLYWAAALTSLVGCPFLFLAGRYALAGALGVAGEAVDLVLASACLAAGFGLLATRERRFFGERLIFPLLVAAICMTAAFVVFTFYKPGLPVFLG